MVWCDRPQVREAVARSTEGGKLVPPTVEETSGQVSSSKRLHVRDRKSDQQFLVDTGADISIILKPQNAGHHQQISSYSPLTAYISRRTGKNNLLWTWISAGL